MADTRRRWALFAVLVLVLILVIWSPWSADAPATTPARARNPRAAATASSGEPPSDIRLELLRQARAAPAPKQRDPFRFERPPAPPREAAPIARREPELPPVPTGPPPPPPITLKLIGFLQKPDGVRIAVLSDGKRPIHGTEGQQIEGRYQILRVNEESIEVAYLDGRGRQTLRLGAQ